MANNVVISQARTGSTRLPDKVLLRILDKEILLHLVDRVLAAKTVDHLIIATTTHPNDDIIVDLVKNYHPGVSVFRGSEEDVLDRYYQAARDYKKISDNPVNVIRITSDCPLIDPQIIDLHVREFVQKKVDYLSSRIDKRTWPHGMELEIFTYDALETAWREAEDSYDREHVTPYIYITGKNKFRLHELSYNRDISNYRLTIDYIEDYHLIKKIFENLYPENPMFGLQEIVSLLENSPELTEINSHRINPKIK